MLVMAVNFITEIEFIGAVFVLFVSLIMHLNERMKVKQAQTKMVHKARAESNVVYFLLVSQSHDDGAHSDRSKMLFHSQYI